MAPSSAHGDRLVMPKSKTRADYDVAIVGGGVYGILLGLNCRAAHQSTVLIENPVATSSAT